MQLQTIQILTNNVQMLILCLSYIITTVLREKNIVYLFLLLRKVKKIVFPRSLKVNTSIHKTEVQNWCTKLPNQSSDWRRVHNRAGGTRGQEGRAPYPTTQILADQVIQFQPVGRLC